MPGKINLPERIMFILGLLVLLALLGYLTMEIIKPRNSPASLQVTTTYDPSVKHNYAYKVIVWNRGHETAQSTTIDFELYQEGKVAGSASLQIDYIPSQSRETAWVVFPQERQPGDSLVMSAMTYLKP